MKKSSVWRYFVTDSVAIPVCKIGKKSDAYNQATGDGYGVVYTDRDGHYICDEDCTARLIDEYGNECGIYPNEELNRKQWFKQAECKTIITSDSCGLSFYGDVKICVSYDLNGYIDTYRVTDINDGLYEGETVVKFEDLPEEDPYFDIKAEMSYKQENIKMRNEKLLVDIATECASISMANAHKYPDNMFTFNDCYTEYLDQLVCGDYMTYLRAWLGNEIEEGSKSAIEAMKNIIKYRLGLLV